jgi:HlyD family type I secretion membrane fusion protein
VVGLTAFTVGGVIAAGERIMEIVPDGGELIVEATVNVEDQEDVRSGMKAEVHLVAYRQRSSPVVPGTVLQVSADRLTDPRTGLGYYLAQVQLEDEAMLRTKDIRLAPGMPALVIIPTSERTALDYLLQPLTDSFNRAFREK